MRITGRHPVGEHERRYNRPTAAEVALLVVGNPRSADPRDVVVRVRGEYGRLVHLNVYNAAFDSLYFVLLFPCGDSGWCPDLPHDVEPATWTLRRACILDPDHPNASVATPARPSARRQLVFPDDPEDVHRSNRRGSGTVTLRQFAAFYLMQRKDPLWSHPLHRCGALFQEWIVVQWSKCEEAKLLWLRSHQSDIRADSDQT